jgi:cytochrome c-type biogenesis protein
VEVQVSFALAFAAGIVSFLSPCVLPVVPSYVAFVSGLTLSELTEGDVGSARRTAVLHSTLFMVGFGVVFLTLGTAATAVGSTISAWLPWLNRLGGVVIVLFGLQLLGLLRLPALLREGRLQLDRRPAGVLGSVLVGIAFGAGWTPCIGPILGSILLYAGMESTMVHGTLLLATYALGLGIPFVLASATLNRFLAVSAGARGWLLPIQRVAGTVLTVIGLLMVTGRFATMTAFLAGMGQLINLDIS